MIERATQLRLSRNWQGALAAANIDLTRDLAGVATRYGSAVAVAMAMDLVHLAPDLLRWHLPRYLRGRTTIWPDQRVILAGYGDRPGDGPYLYVTTQHNMVDGPQRLSLRFGSVDRDGREQNWTAARYLWDARCAGELRERSGGGERAPFCNADGTPRAASELPVADPGAGDPAGHTEWVTRLYDREDVQDAFSAAGIVLDELPPKPGCLDPRTFLRLLSRFPLALTRLEPEIRLRADAGLGSRFHIPLTRSTALLLELDAGGNGLQARHASDDQVKDVSTLPQACWRRLPDIDLLRHGDIVPEHLHPLVSASLFPRRSQADGADGPPDTPLPVPVRIRCRGEWHEACSRDGRLDVPHSDKEQRRERALRAFGGPVAGCFAIQQAWTSGIGQLPRALREQRQQLFSLIQHGDTPGVLRLLDAGVDPRVRDGRQRTLLHVLHLLDHDALLPRLVVAGLNIEARDHHERTPLHVAVGDGSVALVWALLGAGARTDVVDREGCTLPGLIVRFKRKELHFLKDAVETEHPDLVRKYPSSGEWDE